MFFSINAFASHTIKLKITNNNSDNNCQDKWCQVYVEIPARLYMEEGWLREDLRNLKFIDEKYKYSTFKNIDNGIGNYDICTPNSDEENALTWWVDATKNGEFKINRLPVWLLVYDLKPGETRTINMVIDDKNKEYHANPRALVDFRGNNDWNPDGDCEDQGEDNRKYPARFGTEGWETIGKSVFYFFAHGLWGDFIGWQNSNKASWNGYAVPQYGIDDNGSGSFGNAGFCNWWTWHAHCVPNLRVMMDYRYKVDKYCQLGTGWDKNNGTNWGAAVETPFTLSFTLYYKSTDVIKTWNSNYANKYGDSQTGGILYVYFLTQLSGKANYWSGGCSKDWHDEESWRCSPNAMDINSFPGYRLKIVKPIGWNDYTDDKHYHRYFLKIYLDYQISKKGGWTQLAEFDYPLKESDVSGKKGWFLYDATKHRWDIKVGPDKIYVYVNGEEIGKVDRQESWQQGFFGFDRKYWVTADWNDINEIMVRAFFKEEPKFKVYGNTDAVVYNENKGKWVGKNLIELVPEVQQLEKQPPIGGNTLDDYIYRVLNLPESNQVAQFKIGLRNRGDENDNFTLSLEKKVYPPGTKWVIYWCDGSGKNCTFNTPATFNVPAHGELIKVLKFFPSPQALFEGGDINFNLKFTSQKDLTEDNLKLRARINTNLGCWWEKKLPITITWNKIPGYEVLKDYQVRINLSNLDFSEALDSGSDIVVTDQNGNKIPFYLKKFDKDNGKIDLWVKVPEILNGNTTKIYIWWGNKNFAVSLSNPKDTFDLWETWDLYPVRENFKNNNIGCPDDSPDCDSGDFYCPPSEECPYNIWKNVTASGQNYNWWFVANKLEKVSKAGYNRAKHNLDSIALLSDIFQLTPPNGESYPYADQWPCKAPSLVPGKSGWHSCEWGPILRGGSRGWTHYEVMYKLKFLDSQYLGSNFPNPVYNPVFFTDFGNGLGLEIFKESTGDQKFILRPMSAGIDWVWQKQSKFNTNLQTDKWYVIKSRVFKKNDGNLNTSFLITDKINSDTDDDSNFEKIGDLETPLMFSPPYGAIGFSGWDGGWAIDNIRVRKFVKGANGKEPICSPGSTETLSPREKFSLSQPQITPPFFSGREAYLVSETTPFSWLGDIKAYDAECYIGDNCNDDENPNELGTISMFGEIDDNASEAKGLGYFLMKQLPKNRTIYTLDDNATNNQSNGFDYFNLSDCKNLENVIGSTGTCNANDNLSDETEKIIEFVRGKFIKEFPKSKSRDMDEKYGNDNGIPDDNEQWKLGDIIHSNPIIIGLPNMHWADDSYQQWVNDMREKARPLMLYTLSNDGMLHAFKIAYYDKDANPPRYEVVDNPVESWAFVPNGVLHKLKEISEGTGHQYTNDGLLRSIDIYDSSKNKWMTVLFGLLGRGGEGLFAIDITDPNNPKLLWDINRYKNPGAFSKIGTTISSPAMGKINISGSVRWVAFLGSGFDFDFLKNLTTKHAYLTIVDLLNGQILKQIKVSDKISDVLTNIAPLRSADGYLRKIYFGDYYGALWRINITNSSDNNTAHFNQLLQSSESVLNSEDMLFKPADYDSTQFPNTVERPITAQPIPAWDGSNWWVYFGTGDYSDLNYDYSSDGDSIYPYQRFYGLKDKDEDNVTYEDSSLYNMTDPDSINSSDSSWFIELGHNNKYDVEKTLNDNGSLISSQNKNSNERVLQKAEVYNGIVFFTTFQPNDSPCGGGISRFYSVNYKTGGLVQQLFGFSNGNQTEYKTARSVQLSGNEVPSKPMIYKGEGSAKAIAAGVVNKGGQLEKIKLNPSKFLEKIDIRLWRVVK